jgi:hypothetical protein
MPLDENAILDESAARHLLRRSGFGAPPAQLEDFVGRSRGVAADLLLGFKPNGFEPNGKAIDDVRNKWIAYMLKVKAPLQEKLVLFGTTTSRRARSRSRTRSSSPCRTGRCVSTAKETSRAS